MSQTSVSPDAIPGPLKNIAVYIGGFFSFLSLVVAAFPHLQQLRQAMPVPEPENFSTVAATVLSLGVVGHGYLRAKAGHKTIYGTGLSWLVSAILIAAGYIYAVVPSDGGSFVIRWVALLSYVAAYCCATKGFWEMGLFAYAADDRLNEVTVAEPGLPISSKVAALIKAQRNARFKKVKAAYQAEKSQLQANLSEIESKNRKLKNYAAALKAEKEELKRQEIKTKKASQKRRSLMTGRLGLLTLVGLILIVVWVTTQYPLL